MKLKVTGWVDLHRHHDTSHTPESIHRVAHKFGISPFVNMTIEEIRQAVQAPPGSDWNQWYECLKKVRKTYVSPAVVAEMTHDVVSDAAQQSLAGLELRVSLLSTVTAVRENNPHYAAMNFWVVAREIMDRLVEIKRQWFSDTMTLDLIMSISCQNKHLPLVDDYVNMMKEYAADIIAIDLTNEEDNKPSTYKRAIDRIRDQIPFLTIHCMEKMGPDRGWDALTLSPQRLGHGIRAIEDPKLVEEISTRGIVLEVCPLSNILTGVATRANHPFKKLDQAGITVTINHDGLNDDTTLKDDYTFIQSAFGYSDNDMERFAENGRKAAFRNMRQD